jgi:hypothetical protein
MTPHEIELALALRHNVGMLPGSSQKRFARDIAHIAATDPTREITLRQRHYIELMAWRYRRQLPAHLIPHAKPFDLPPARKEPKPSRRKVDQAEMALTPMLRGIVR